MSMGIPLEVLKLTRHDFPDRLPAPMGSAERRSPICGSRVIVDINIDNTGRITALGMRVNACAFGQAASAIMAKTIIGLHVSDVVAAQDQLARWIAGESEMPSWPGIEILRPERLNGVRKTSVQLAFQAAAEAAATAARAEAA